jgi:hypothetical protein
MEGGGLEPKLDALDVLWRPALCGPRLEVLPKNELITL